MVLHESLVECSVVLLEIVVGHFECLVFENDIEVFLVDVLVLLLLEVGLDAIHLGSYRLRAALLEGLLLSLLVSFFGQTIHLGPLLSKVATAEPLSLCFELFLLLVESRSQRGYLDLLLCHAVVVFLLEPIVSRLLQGCPKILNLLLLSVPSPLSSRYLVRDGLCVGDFLLLLSQLGLNRPQVVNPLFEAAVLLLTAFDLLFGLLDFVVLVTLQLVEPRLDLVQFLLRQSLFFLQLLDLFSLGSECGFQLHLDLVLALGRR
mmetsp:Transcript_43220/g.107985  ORF Transcript_43220/g.107985 Transcript_43220/m.107985 type:complete len:261 (+) Transcript_43220:675-1457(+)